MTVISGEYSSFKHVKTRKVVVLEIEVAEEHFQNVITTLGMPIGGESKPVAVALLDKSVVSKKEVTEKSEGERLRIRAVMLCKEDSFGQFLANKYFSGYGEDNAKNTILNICHIESRADIANNPKAQQTFKELDAQYKEWLNPVDKQYEDNLSRD